MTYLPSKRTLLIAVMFAGAVTWLALWHQPWVLVRSLAAPTAADSVLFSADGLLLVVPPGGAPQAWDVTTGAKVGRFDFVARDADVRIWPGAVRLLVSHGETAAEDEVWDTRTAKVVARIPLPYSRLKYPYVPLLVGTNGRYVTYSRYDRLGDVWDVEHTDIAGRATQIARVPDGRLLIASAGQLVIANIPIDPTLPYGLRISAEDKRTAGIVGFQGAHPTVCVWDAATGAQVHAYALPAARLLQPTLSDDGHYLAAYDVKYGMFTLDTRTGDAAWYSSKRPLVPRSEIRFWPDDSKFFAAGTGTEDWTIYDTRTAKPMSVLHDLGPGPAHAAIAPDGKLLALLGDPNRPIDIYRNVMRDSTWGMLGLPPAWVSLGLACIAVASFGRDLRRRRRCPTGSTSLSPQAQMNA